MLGSPALLISVALRFPAKFLHDQYLALCVYECVHVCMCVHVCVMLEH